MPVPTTTIRIDEEAKRAARPILDMLGLNISSATNIFLKAVVRCNGLPFDLKLASIPNVASGNDFTADYLAPLMGARNESSRIGYNPDVLRKRLSQRNEIINGGRRSIT